MLLAIDIGNSNVVVGVYQDHTWQHIWRFPTLSIESPQPFYQQKLFDHLLEANLFYDGVDEVAISSVVPALTPHFLQIVTPIAKNPPLVLGPEVYKKLSIQIKNPYEIGADLVANAVAAYQLYQKDLIITDFGTALTFTIINNQGSILGVTIAPGIKTAIAALYQKTAQLPPEVPLVIPDSAIGKDTVHAIQSGILIGYVGLVRHMIHTIKEELGQHYQTIATGGLSGTLTDLMDDFDIRNPNLTLEGLRLISAGKYQ